MLVRQFGDPVRGSQKTEFILDLGEKELKVYIVQEDRPLGLAFVHKAPYADEIYPVIAFTSSGSCEIKEQDTKNLKDLLVKQDYKNKSRLFNFRN